ncbi:MAG: DEAD/DEAH box helicase [Candidatus Diapherotrites archaeon]
MDVAKLVQSANGFPSFNPLQEKVLAKEWAQKSFVVSSPTASGKTVLAELLALESVLHQKRKVVYTCPLRALASEHFQDWKKKYSSSLNIRIALSTGDFDSSSSYLKNYDIILCTYEKLDSCLRNNSEWLQSVGLLVVDEIHSLGTDRGPTLEMAVTKLRLLNPSLKVLGLSATIPNAKELAQWLDAELVESDFRPVKLREGIFFQHAIHFPKEVEKVSSSLDPVHALVEDVLEQKEKQVLVFANTRKRAEGLAEQLAKLTFKKLSDSEKTLLEKEALKALNVLESPTEQCHKLANLLRQGVCFHHAGLLSQQREIVESLFKSNHLKALAATPTLAAGINLPAYRVVISSLYRYGEYGQERIPVSEYKQMCGRSGRPKYDTEGQSVIIARNELEIEDLKESYINGEIEKIESKLSLEPVLRTHLLAAIASHYIFDLDSMEKFFGKTFYALQYGEMRELFSKMETVLEQLREWGFVKADEKRFQATLLGKRVSELYLDPLSAFEFLQKMRLDIEFSLSSYLMTLVQSSEMFPLPSIPKTANAEVMEFLQEARSSLPFELDRELFEEPELFKQAGNVLLLQDWMNEKTEQDLLSNYNIQPGVLHAKLERLDWLSYSLYELCRLVELEKHLVSLSKLRSRLKYGVKEELLALCQLKGIGRVRARRLWKASLRTVAALKAADVKDLEKVLGVAVAAQVKSQLGQK